jgi:hypothetical protein
LPVSSRQNSLYKNLNARSVVIKHRMKKIMFCFFFFFFFGATGDEALSQIENCFSLYKPVKFYRVLPKRFLERDPTEHEITARTIRMLLTLDLRQNLIECITRRTEQS